MNSVNKSFFFFLAVCLLGGTALAQELSPKQVASAKKEIATYQNEIKRLKNKLAKTYNKKTQADIKDAIDTNQSRINKLKAKLYPKPQVLKPTLPETTEVAVVETAVTQEAEETKLPETKPEQKRIQLKFGVGGVTGVFCGGSAYLAEMRFPLRIVIGPAVTSFRLSTGLVLGNEISRKYLPINADLVFGFPPGWFTGTDNYIGFGLNYTALTSGRVAGTMGGQIFYGVESEGFGGIVFGEMGFGSLRTGFSPSQDGLTVMLGYRMLPGF